MVSDKMLRMLDEASHQQLHLYYLTHEHVTNMPFSVFKMRLKHKQDRRRDKPCSARLQRPP
jgi:hypothetical protein